MRLFALEISLRDRMLMHDDFAFCDYDATSI